MSKREIQSAFNKAINFSLSGKTDSSQHERDLQSAARKEAVSSETIILTKENLTPGMRAQCIQPYFTAIEEWTLLKNRFDISTQPYRSEMEEQKSPAIKQREIEEESQAEIARAKELALQDSHFADALKEKEDAETIYETMVNQHSRQAMAFPVPVYLFLLLGIGAVEWLVNASTFQANWGIPALSAGFTIVVALAVAFAAHEHGTLFKQREHWLGDHIDPTKKRWQLLWLSMATTALVLVLIWVGLERYQWGITEVARLGIGEGNRNLLGTSSTITINVPQKVTMSIFANVLVWLLGCAIAYWTHDTDPEFTAAKKRRDKSLSVYRKRGARLEKKLNRYRQRGIEILKFCPVLPRQKRIYTPIFETNSNSSTTMKST